MYHWQGVDLLIIGGDFQVDCILLQAEPISGFQLAVTSSGSP